MEHPDTCVNPQPNYYCPTVGEVESPCHGGFDTCCTEPVLHINLPVGELEIGRRLAQLERVSMHHVSEWGDGVALLDQAWDLINEAPTDGNLDFTWQRARARFNQLYTEYMNRTT